MESGIILSRDECNNLNLEWSIQLRSQNMSGEPFQVWYASDDTYTYFKPYMRYKKYEFEKLMKFSMGSPDFDLNRVVRYLK